jgi:hypothetical protein
MNWKNTLLIFVSVILSKIYAYSQSVGIGTTTPNTSAQLDVSSSSKGILIPRMTTAQRDGIANPANGLMIYNSATRQYNFYNGTRWQTINDMPKGAIIMGENFDDTTITKEGYRQLGYISHDMTEQTTGDTTIPAYNWYTGNRLTYQNTNAPLCNAEAFTCYTGSDFLVFDRTNIFLYNQQTDKWTIRNYGAITYDTLLVAMEHGGTMVWTGTECIFWGGGYISYCTGIFPNQTCYPGFYSNSGIKYNPATNTWTLLSNINAPSARKNHKAVWTGTEMVIWGGRSGDSLHHYSNTGAKYNPVTNSWAPMPVPIAFQGREDFTMTKADNNIIIWGGKSKEPKSRLVTNPCDAPNTYTAHYDSIRNFNDGRIYSLVNNNWANISMTNAPMARHHASAVWAYDKLIVAGGVNTGPFSLYCGICTFPPIPIPQSCSKQVDADSILNTGASYDPIANMWTAIPNAPKKFKNLVGMFDNEQYLSFFGEDTILSYEPSAGDWFENIIPPLQVFENTNTNQRQIVWQTGFVGGQIELITIPYIFCNGNKYVYNLKATPITLHEIKNTISKPDTRFYLYKKE